MSKHCPTAPCACAHLPSILQVKALAISTALTGAIGALALGGLKYGGLGARDIAEVASWRGAIQAAQCHRASIHSSLTGFMPQRLSTLAAQ